MRVFVVAFLGLLAACGKTDVGGHIEWRSLAEGERIARRENRPLLVFVGAQWDVATKELERHTFRDPHVRAHVAKNFVTASSDMTDDELPRTIAEHDRLRVVGTPSLVVRTPDGNAEVGIATSFMNPDELVAFLDRCLARMKDGHVVADQPYGAQPRSWECR